jgi:hypothetical protein
MELHNLLVGLRDETANPTLYYLFALNSDVVARIAQSVETEQ